MQCVRYSFSPMVPSIVQIVVAFAALAMNCAVTGFAPLVARVFHHKASLLPLRVLPVESSSSILLNAVEYFDGSSIVDPVVVSSVFWNSLLSKLTSFIIGQVLAVIVFGIILSLASTQIAKVGEWVSNELLKSKPNQGQRLNTPKPININNLGQADFKKLFFCIAIDVIGTSSELLPILGEVTDIVWAPIAALALRSLYGSNVVLVLEFVEEILPFTDILPLATICWVVDTFSPDSDIAKLLQLGRYSRVVNGGSTIMDNSIETKRRSAILEDSIGNGMSSEEKDK
jgi:hypothetical protein